MRYTFIEFRWSHVDGELHKRVEEKTYCDNLDTAKMLYNTAIEAAKEVYTERNKNGWRCVFAFTLRTSNDDEICHDWLIFE